MQSLISFINRYHAPNEIETLLAQHPHTSQNPAGHPIPVGYEGQTIRMFFSAGEFVIYDFVICFHLINLILDITLTMLPWYLSILLLWLTGGARNIPAFGVVILFSNLSTIQQARALRDSLDLKRVVKEQLYAVIWRDGNLTHILRDQIVSYRLAGSNMSATPSSALPFFKSFRTIITHL